MIISDGRKIKVYNGTGSTIDTNKIVVVKGKRVTIASNTNTDAGEYPLGYTLSSINPGGYGEVLLEGSIQNINTSSYIDGALLYLSTSGNITTTKPATTIILGAVITSDPTSGSIYFKVFFPKTTWGDITGNVLDQADLQNELNIRVPYTGADHDVDLGTYKITMNDGVTDTEMSPSLFGVENNDKTQFATLEHTGMYVSNNTTSNTTSVTAEGITFQDASFQDTAFPPTGGTDAEYIKGDGTLGTFPTGSGLPTGGTTGQILTKISNTDGDASWMDNYADWTSVVKHTVKNDGTAVIAKGKAVYASGADGTNILVRAASNSSEATSSKTMGLMQSQLNTSGGSQTGFVITEGLLGGLDTQGQTAGDPVWLGTNGDLIYGLANKPAAPNHLVFIGIVTKVSAGSGEIFVKVQNGFEVRELHDVSATSPSNNDVLRYNSSNHLWEAAPVIVPAGMTWMGAFPG